MKSKHIFLISILSTIYARVLLMYLPKDNAIIKISVSIGSILLIAVLLFLFIHFQFRRKESNITGGKEVILRGGANNFGVGGYLILTSEEIIFKAHILNVQKYTLIIPLKVVVDVQPVDVMGMPKGLLITDNSIVHKFTVNKRKLWIDNIEKLIKI